MPADRPFISGGLRRLTLLGLTLVLAVAAGDGRAFADHGELDVQITGLAQTEADEVVAIVSVLDHGRPVAGLTASAFAASEDGQTAPILSVTSSESSDIPLAVVVTLDTSGSMAGTAMSASLAAASEFVSRLAPADSAAVVSFADAAAVRQGFTVDRAAVLNVLASLAATGNTALFDAVATAAELAANAGTARKAVLLLSDGEDFGGLSATTREESLGAAEQSSAVFYTIGLGTSIDEAYLEELASRSGGRYFAAPGPADIAGIYQSLSEQLRTQYVVTLRTPGGQDPGTRAVTIVAQTPEGSGEATAPYAPLIAGTVEPSPVPSPSIAAPESTPPPTAAAAAPTDNGDGGTELALAAGAGVLLTAGGIGLLFIKKKRSAAQLGEDSSGRAEAPPTKPLDPVLDTEVHGELRIKSPGASEWLVPIGQHPITVGHAPDADIVLQREPGVAAHHLRLWWRDGRLMLHHLDQATQTLVNGDAADWIALEPGDEIAVGDYRLVYKQSPPGNSSS